MVCARFFLAGAVVTPKVASKTIEKQSYNLIKSNGNSNNIGVNGSSNIPSSNGINSGSGDQKLNLKEKVYQKKGNFPEDKQAIIAHASRISGNNLDFIATLDKENAGTWDVNIISKPNRNGTYDKGLCQFNSAYYSHLYELPEWNNPEWQINKCYDLYTYAILKGKIKTTFYGYNLRQKSKLNFELK